MRHSAFSFVVLAVALLLLSTSASATIVYVKWDSPGPTYDGKTWGTAFHTVQSGLNAANSGDQVWVARGRYTEFINLTLGVGLYGGFVGNETNLAQRPPFPRSAPDPNESILDANLQWSTVSSPRWAGADTRIDGFVIRGGYDDWGGGIYCLLSSPTISNNTITGNWCCGIKCKHSSPTISNNLFLENYGSGVLCLSSSPQISGNTFSGNDADIGGGIYGDGVSSPTVRNNLFQGNRALWGGGIYCDLSETTISNNTFRANRAWYGGGGICSGGPCMVVNNTFVGNSAGSSGGGILCSGWPAIYNNTFVGNDAIDGGGICGGDVMRLFNNIIAFNSTGFRFTAESGATAGYNNVFGNSGYDYSGISPAFGDISVDPLFESLEQGDLHLKRSSPCIDAGTNNRVPPRSSDMDETRRIQGRRADMGADEYPVEGAAGIRWSRLEVPRAVRPGRTYTLWLNYGNAGAVDLPAPLFVISSPSGAPMCLDEDDPFETSPIQILGIAFDGQPGILKPGSAYRIPVYFQGIEDPAIQFHVEAMTDDNPPINWPAFEQQIRPPDMDPAVWDPAFARLKTQIGTNWEEYANVLRANADRLALRGRWVYDVRELFGMELDEALGRGISAIQGTLTDSETSLPISDVEVFARRTDGQSIGNATTDMQGNFLIQSLLPGDHEISAEDYYFAEIPVVSVLHDADVLGMALSATRIPEDPAIPAPGVPDSQPEIIRDASGKVHLIWQRGSRLWHAAFGDGVWQVTGTVADAEAEAFRLGSHPALLAGYPDACIVVWQDGVDNESDLVYSIGRPDGIGSGFTWTEPQVLTSDAYGDGPLGVGILADGVPLVVWLKKDFSIEDDTDLYYETLSIPEDLTDWQFSAPAKVNTLGADPWCVSVEFGKRRVFSDWIPVIGGEYKFHLWGQACLDNTCDPALSVGCVLDARLGEHLSIKGSGGITGGLHTNSKECSYVFDQATADFSATGSANVKLIKIPVAKRIDRYLSAGISGVITGGISGKVGWKGCNFPSWPNYGKVEFTLGAGLAGEAKFGLNRRDPLAKIKVQAVGTANLKWEANKGWTTGTGCLRASAEVKGGILKWSWSGKWGDCAEATSVPMSGDLPGSLVLSEFRPLGEDSSVQELVVSVDPMLGTGSQYPGSPVLGDISADVRNDGTPAIACSDIGQTIAVWTKDSTDPSTSLGSAVVSAGYDESGWHSPIELDSSARFNSGPDVVFDSDGNPMVVWSSASTEWLTIESPAEDFLYYMESSDVVFSRRVGNDWSTPSPVAELYGRDDSVSLASGPSGKVLAAWVHTDGDYSTIQSSIWDGTTWSVPEQVSTGPSCQDPTCAFTGDTPVIVWVEDTDGASETDGDLTLYWSTRSTAWAAPQAFAKESPASSTSAAALNSRMASSQFSPPDECCDDDPDHPDPPTEPEPDDAIALGVWPIDPNEKVGPPGQGDQRLVSPLDELEYIVYFENQSAATAPVQEAQIIDYLSPSLDWSTFRLHEIAFGDTLISAGDLPSHSSSVYLPNLRIDITAGVDLQTGRAQWVLRSMDPATGQPPEDPLVGFLPPNDGTHRGEGHLTFRITPKPQVAAGTIISNAASIVFDGMTPIATNSVTNTIALLPPGAAEGPSPSNQATGIQVNTPLTWRPAQRTTLYDLYLWRDGDPRPVTPTVADWPATGYQPVRELDPGTAYRWQVAARNSAGETLGPEWMFTTAPLPPVSSATASPDQTAVKVSRAIVSASFQDCFYIEQDNRARGIRVSKPQHGLSVGTRADVCGLVKTNIDGERYLDATWVTPNGTGRVDPLGMDNRAIGGGDWLCDPADLDGSGQGGVLGSQGLNNIGLLIKIWGMVTQKGTDYLYIDDGWGARDGTFSIAEENIGVRVVCEPAKYSRGDAVEVTGISSCFRTPSGDIARCILVRGSADLRNVTR